MLVLGDTADVDAWLRKNSAWEQWDMKQARKGSKSQNREEFGFHPLVKGSYQYDFKIRMLHAGFSYFGRI